MAVKINEELLARAVEAKIRPLLFDQRYLDIDDYESYHHEIIIPKAQPLLARQKLEADDARKAVTDAIAANINLLGRFETIQARQFLEECRPSDVRERTVELLYGNDPLDDRITAFLKWGGKRKVKKGKKTQDVGLNATSVSYLLAMSNPNRYAFCKPRVYEAAARVLLGKDQVESDPVRRIIHCTEFYKAALELFRTRHGLDRFTDLMYCHTAFYIMDNYDKIPPTWDTLAAWTPPRGATQVKDGQKETGAQTMTAAPLNLILYGPPGTGKTYNTIRQAVATCDGSAANNRKELVARFNALREQGRIEFVTFHQSYGYEEFVEGIRPVLVDDEGEGAPEGGQELRYEQHDGVFKDICGQAMARLTTAQHKFDVDLAKHRVWKMSLGNTLNPEDADVFEECIRAGQIRLGYGNQRDFTGCDDLPAILNKIREVEPDAVEGNYKVISVQLLKNEMKIGDLVIVSDGNKKFRAIGKLTGAYEHIVANRYDQVRKVEWLLTPPESLSVDTILRKRFSQKTLYPIGESILKVDALAQLLSGEEPATPLPHVLIIDEINRGNISKIFGELITLIEQDKRLGAENELRVKLPYSGKQFGVPSNLYLIGTMNTADRSIAFLDTALRRRFRFREMMPDAQVIRDNVGNNGAIDGIDIAAMLETINRRIELLFDRDHQIGHSYFLGIRSLADLIEVIRFQVLPLLQEYFHDDWTKICHVLACPYDGETGKALSKNPLPLIVTLKLDGALIPGTEPEDMDLRPRYALNPLLDKQETKLQDCFAAVLNGDVLGLTPPAEG